MLRKLNIKVLCSIAKLNAPTPEAKIKSKIFRYQNREVPLTWICKAPKYTGQEWITYEELIKVRKKRKKEKMKDGKD